jgi:hypothetical protein
MNRNGILLLILLVLGVLGYQLYKKKGNQTASTVSWDMDFTMPDTAAIKKIFFADRKGNKITLDRQTDHWTVNGLYKVRPTAIELLLSTFSKQQVKYIPPKAAQKHMISGLVNFGIKAEIYTNDTQKPFKVFYVGDVTSDETGTHMLMEGAEQPYVVHMPAFVGAVRGRYMLKLDDWKDRNIFRDEPSTIQTLSVEYPRQKSASFILDKVGDDYIVKPFFSTQQVFASNTARKGIAASYLVQYKSLTAEAFETYNQQRDSVTALIPFAVITLTKTDGMQKQVKFHPVKTERDAQTGAPYVFRYYADCSWGDFMLAQSTVFAGIFRGYDYFFEGRPEPGSRIKQ